MAGYVVTGPQAVVIVAGRRVYLGHGALLPEGVDEARTKHLLDLGMIAAVKEEQSDNPDAPKAVKDMTAGELKAYAAEHSIVIPNGNKAEVLAAIEAAQASQPDAGQGESEPEGDGSLSEQ